MNILFYAAINEMTNRATEKFLEEYYNHHNVLIYDMMEECEFEPKVDMENIYDAALMHDRKYRNVKGYYSFPPVDERLLQRMSRYEAEIYKMMDLYFPPIESFNERQRLYYSALRLLNGIIEKNAINCYVQYGLPHVLFDFILYCLCKAKGIQTVLMMRTPVVGAIYYFYDLTDHMPKIKKVDGARIEDLNKLFRNHYLLYTRKSSDGVWPYYMSKGTVREKISFLQKRIKHFFKVKDSLKNIEIVLHLERKKRKKESYIAQNSVNPNFDEKYIYFALHYQPEATTSPSAGVFVNQQLAIQMLSYYVSDDVYIYVKEHPNQRLRGERYRSFFEEIKELRNVKIMPASFSSNEIENHAVAIATCTGTVAYEAMFKNKPSILFGYYVYNYLPGAFTVRNNDDCQKAVDKILAGVNISDQDILNYILTLQNISYHAEVSPEFKSVMQEQGIGLQENNSTVFRMLCDAVDGLKKCEE